MINRRGFLKTAAWTGALLPLSSQTFAQLSKATRLAYLATKNDSPIANVAAVDSSSLDFNGDDIHRPHDLLWNVDGYIARKGGLPIKAESYDFIVVGGGISGLLSAHYLLKKNPRARILLLEQDPRFGGNSKGETYGTRSSSSGPSPVTYSIGAAYIIEPETGSDIEQLLSDLKLDQASRTEKGDDLTVAHGGLLKRFWEGESAPEAKAQLTMIRERLKDFAENGDLEFGGALCQQLDGMSFQAWLQNEFGEIHPHVLEFFQLYGWSSFCGSIDELSAFQFLNFICFEFGNILAFPGGNGAIAQALVRSLRGPDTNAIPRRRSQAAAGTRLESGAMVLQVSDEGALASVAYENALGELKVARASKVVMACPKFVARKLISGLQDDQAKAIDALTYRAYLVGNVLLNRPMKSPTFDLFSLRGSMPPSPTAMRTGDRNYSDICFGSWAQSDQVTNSVLTLYSGLAYDGARQFLFNPASHDKHKARMLKELSTALPTLGLSENDILGVRMTRWGHALPLAARGLISKGITALAARPVGQTIVFANQDNFANPAFETAHQAAVEASS